MKTLLAIAVAAAPGFAISTIAPIIPILVGAFLIDTGVLNYKKLYWENYEELSIGDVPLGSYVQKSC